MPNHIIVVDDEPDITDLYQHYLQWMGYRVSIAHDGRKALELDEKDPADLVITDLTMPLMDGKELTESLHRKDPIKPVIIVSAYTANARMQDAHTSICTKPVSMQLLGLCVNEMLKRHEMEMQSGSASLPDTSARDHSADENVLGVANRSSDTGPLS